MGSSSSSTTKKTTEITETTKIGDIGLTGDDFAQSIKEIGDDQLEGFKTLVKGASAAVANTAEAVQDSAATNQQALKTVAKNDQNQDQDTGLTQNLEKWLPWISLVLIVTQGRLFE